MESEEIESSEGWGEEKIAHKLRFDGETRGMRETERMVGAASAEQSLATIKADYVEDGLKPANKTNNRGGDEK